MGDRDLAHLDRVWHRTPSRSYEPSFDGEGRTTVPAVPAAPVTILSRLVMTPTLPVASTNRQIASTFGPIEPLANWPSERYRRISVTSTSPMGLAPGVPKPSTAFCTSVATTRRSTS